MNPTYGTETDDTETCTSEPAELIYTEESLTSPQQAIVQPIENVLGAVPIVALSGSDSGFVHQSPFRFSRMYGEEPDRTAGHDDNSPTPSLVDNETDDPTYKM